MNIPCPICGSESSYLFTSKHERKVLLCSNSQCQHLFTPPLESSQGVHDRPEDIESESDKSLQIYGERNERLLKLFVNAVVEENRSSQYVFIDFGAGDAHISRTFKSVLKDKVDIYCIEEEEKCKALYSKYGLIHIAEPKEMPTKADLIYLIEVIEHVVDPIQVFGELRRVLTKNGKIFLSTPAGHVNERRTNAYDNPTHLHFFTPLSLNLALLMAGFAPIQYRFFSEMYPLPGLPEKEKGMIRSIYRRFTNLLSSLRLSNSAVNNPISLMDIPPSLDGKAYPYHLVGFSKALD